MASARRRSITQQVASALRRKASRLLPSRARDSSRSAIARARSSSSSVSRRSERRAIQEVSAWRSVPSSQRGGELGSDIRRGGDGNGDRHGGRCVRSEEWEDRESSRGLCRLRDLDHLDGDGRAAAETAGLIKQGCGATGTGEADHQKASAQWESGSQIE